MKKHRAQSSSLFLMELILSILFFSIASAVCVQFFVKSHILSSKAGALSHAVSDCSDAADALRAAKDPGEAEAFLFSLYPDAEETKQGNDFTVTICFADDFAHCKKETAAYAMRVSLTDARQDEALMKGQISYYEYAPDAATSADAIYSLSVLCAERRPAHE